MSVTEASAVGVAGVLISTVIRGEFTWGLLRGAAMQTLQTVGMIVWIGIGASALVGVFNLMGGINFVSGLILLWERPIRVGDQVLVGDAEQVVDLAGERRDGERGDDGRFTLPPSSNHPQFAMHALLDRFGIKRRDVESLAEPAPQGREVLVSETMRPSTATAQWHDRLERPEIVARISAGMTNLTVVEAPSRPAS